MPTHYLRFAATRLQGVKTEALGVVNGSVFFIMSVHNRVIGRSRYLPRDSVDFDGDFDSTAWVYECFLDEAAAQFDLPVVIDWYVDRGDYAARRLQTDTASIVVTLGSAPGAGDLTLDLSATQGRCQFQYQVATLPEAEDIEASLQRRSDNIANTVIATDEALLTSITAVDGLYKPVALDADEPRRSMPEKGYKSEDGLGRIYISHDLTPQWQAHTQFIELHACVMPVGIEVAPGALRMDWYLETLLDTALSSLDVHHQAVAARPLVVEWPEMPWQSAGKFELLGASRTMASTQLDMDYYSRVRLHCPDLGGARFRVRAIARFDGGQPRRPLHSLFNVINAPRGRGARYEVGDTTGPMTMWKRVDVEYRKMAHALDLPVKQVPAAFEPAFIQLDFLPVKECTRDSPYLGKSGEQPSDLARVCVEREFNNKHAPGHFCLIAIREFAEPPMIANGDTRRIEATAFELRHRGKYVRDGLYYDQVIFELPQQVCLEQIEGVQFEWQVPSGATVNIDFGLKNVRVRKHRLMGYIVPRDATRDLDGLIVDGTDIVERKKLRLSMTGYQRGQQWFPGGFPLADSGVKMTVCLAGDFTLSGYSPPLPHHGKDHFAGRTVVATQDYSFVEWNHQHTRFTPHATCNEDLIITIIHELCHGFGMPHECGFWDYRTPRNQSCALNYDRLWMMGEDLKPEPGSAGKVGRHLCAFHIRALRRVRLEDNAALMAAWSGGGTG